MTNSHNRNISRLRVVPSAPHKPRAAAGQRVTRSQTRNIGRLHIVSPAPHKPLDAAAGRHSLANLLTTLFDMIGSCFDRPYQPRSLNALNGRMLRDIGLSRDDIEAGSRKQFWLR